MDSINWKQKLSSRKFWAVLIAFVGAVGAAFGLSNGSVEQITSIMGAFATLIVYILVEGNIDAHRVVTETVEEGEYAPAQIETKSEYYENGEPMKVITVTTYGDPANND